MTRRARGIPGLRADQQQAMATRHGSERSTEGGSMARGKSETEERDVKEEPTEQELLDKAIAASENLFPTGNGESHSVVPWEARISESIRNDDDAMAIIRELVTEAQANAETSEVRILHRIMAAKSVEETDTSGGLPSVQDMIKATRDGVTDDYFVRGFTLNMSEMKEGEGLPVYCVIDAVNTRTGEAEMFSTGSTQTVFTFVRWREKDWFPVVVRWRRSAKETARGMRPINMEIVNPDPLGRRNPKAEITATTQDPSGWNRPA